MQLNSFNSNNNISFICSNYSAYSNIGFIKQKRNEIQNFLLFFDEV
jgi:hypothetical protein